MRGLIQRVRHAKVTSNETGEILGKIDRGFLVLLGVGVNDTEKEADLLARKIAGMRIFDDEEGHMNRGLADIGGEVLVVSQFTLFADCKRGKRPGFTEAARPEEANRLYRYFIGELQNRYHLPAAEGRFQTDMAVELLNDGPITIWLDTDSLRSQP